jgi:hypothetical protein
MVYHESSTANPASTMRVPGLPEKPPGWYSGNEPNCYACKENYADRPLFSGCDACPDIYVGLELAAEERFAFLEGSRHEPAPQLVRDPIGGLILPLIEK